MPPLFTGLAALTKLGFMNGDDGGLTKRQLGIILSLLGALALVAILAIDALDFGRQGGIGPAQSLALAVAAITALVGLTLIPLGDAPA